MSGRETTAINAANRHSQTVNDVTYSWLFRKRME